MTRGKKTEEGQMRCACVEGLKSNTTIDYVLINVIVTNKFKLHKISTNLKVVPADHEFPYRACTRQQAIAVQVMV
jgi:hypothetical protein